MDLPGDFSLLECDVWCVITVKCSTLSRRMLRLTAKGFAELLAPRPIRYRRDGSEIRYGELLSSMIARSTSPSLFDWFADDKLTLSLDAYRDAASVGNVPFLQYLWRGRSFIATRSDGFVSQPLVTTALMFLLGLIPF